MFPLVVAALVVFAAWCFYPVARVHYREQRQRDRLVHELAAIREHNADLKEQVDRLKTPAGVEDVARRKMGYVRKGEHVYVVTDWTSAEDTAAAIGRVWRAEEPTESLMYRILDVVFGVDG